jgi:hypothetical protein
MAMLYLHLANIIETLCRYSLHAQATSRHVPADDHVPLGKSMQHAEQPEFRQREATPIRTQEAGGVTQPAQPCTTCLAVGRVNVYTDGHPWLQVEVRNTTQRHLCACVRAVTRQTRLVSVQYRMSDAWILATYLPVPSRVRAITDILHCTVIIILSLRVLFAACKTHSVTEWDSEQHTLYSFAIASSSASPRPNPFTRSHTAVGVL